MADTPVVASLQVGSGPPFAADFDGGGTYWPYAKVAFGASGTQSEVADAATKRLPVKVGDGLGAAALVVGRVVLVGNAAAVIVGTAVARRFRLRSDLANPMSTPIYLGPAGVDNTTGFPLWPGDFLPPDVQLSNLNVVFAFCVGAATLYYFGEV